MALRFSYSDVTDNAADKTGPFSPELSAVQLMLVVWAMSIYHENDWLITERTDATREDIAGIIEACLNET